MQGRGPLGKRRSGAPPALLPHMGDSSRVVANLGDRWRPAVHGSKTKDYDKKDSMAGSSQWRPTASRIQVPGNGGDLYTRELTVWRRENAAKKKRARLKARDQMRCGRKVAANTVGSTILVFTKSIMLNTWRWLFFHLSYGFGSWQTTTNAKLLEIHLV